MSISTSSQSAHEPSFRWVQLGLGVICMVMIANLQYGWTYFVDPIDAKYHWGRTDIQWAFTIFVALETWLVPVEGWFVDRYGPRIVVMFGGIMVAIAWWVNSIADTLPLLYLGAVLSGIGAGAVYGTCVGNALKWFADRRGLAAGLTAMGFGAGAALTVAPIISTIQTYGYDRAFLWFGLGQGVVILALSQFLKLQKQLQDMTQKVQQQQQTTDKVQVQQQQQQEQIKAAVPEKDHAFLEHKPGTATFYTPGGEITAYGNLDVSIDATTKGIAGKTAPGSSVLTPTGRVGWMPAVSTNLSYLGLRGFQNLGDFPFNFVWQLETQLDIAATAGTSESNSNASNQVKGALTSRNSFVGLSSEQYGSLYIGKSDAPYKNATQRMNPFSGMIGDYAIIMGNSGGDNRVEFGTRLDHSIWYESPKFSGFTFNALYSPGQNRSSSSDNLAAGESDCTGGNIPGSGGTGGGLTGFPPECNDGAFSDAVSADVVYSQGPLYAVAAYERHMKVNRNSDLLGSPLAPLDTADEDAIKLGVQYQFPTGTTVSGIVERLHRYVPSVLEFQNERQRWGTWFAVTQALSSADTIAVGWAHAFRTPGDPGQHNTPAIAHPNNAANMITAMIRHQFNKYISAYADWAMTRNGPAAHYDLGAGGRAVTTDCHDASDDPAGSASGSESSNPRCWAGGHLMGVSAGMKFQF